MSIKKFGVVLSDDAEIDVSSSYNFYLEINKKLADKFIIVLNKSFDSISKNPFAYMKCYENTRKYVVKKFPFIIYFFVDKSIIKVIAVFHSSRNPEIWKIRQ